MTPDMVTGITQSLPQAPNTKFGPSSQEDKGTPPPNAVAASTKDATSIPDDKVTLSKQLQQPKPEAKKEEAKKEQANTNNEKSNRAIAKAQFVYDLKGDLSIRYMDTADRVIYQVPSELMIFLREAAAKSEASVDMKV